MTMIERAARAIMEYGKQPMTKGDVIAFCAITTLWTWACVLFLF